MQVSRQAIYRTPKRRPAATRRPVTDAVDAAIVEVAKDNPTDGYRMVWALTRRAARDRGQPQAGAAGDARAEAGWFRYLKERCIWRSEFETLNQARSAIAAYVYAYHHRPHSGLDYRTPKEVAAVWEDGLRSLSK